jgi:protoporphyrinogen oxidase
MTTTEPMRISPERMRQLAQEIQRRGIRFADGGEFTADEVIVTGGSLDTMAAIFTRDPR